MKKLTFSFDIGYASIGWSVIEQDAESRSLPSIAGTGVVLFESDSCLASKRREYRRIRRTIRARRKRIERISQILTTHNLITQEESTHSVHPAPYFLAARALQGKQHLTPLELWYVLRWYAHNRGYDGNKQWSDQTEESQEDAKRVVAAKASMAKYATMTMAETIVALLELDTNASLAHLSVTSPKYKKLNLAFPREIVEEEVKKIVSDTPIPQLVKELLLNPVEDYKDELALCDVRFPKRYCGSVLFGQLIPRFDNRIINRCPITWAQVYQDALLNGQDEKMARRAADKYAKVPLADCPEFYEYRFARILANIRVDGAPLSAELRRQLMAFGKAKEDGKFTKTEFCKLVEELTNGAPNNLKNYFQVVPRAEDALNIAPAKNTTKQKKKATGRAPYARPILRQVVEEIMRGEDPTKPVLCPEHPNGEKKANDGILYATLDPQSEVYKLQQMRSIETQTNNHMVRHRMIVFERLLKDMVKNYANNTPALVHQCCIEVNRELREFSGKAAKEIQKSLTEKIKGHEEAVARLEKQAPHLSITAGLIKKCRIAMEMGWKCPYTGETYDENALPKMDKDHIVPFASRKTNAMSALVLTFPEVNKMKGKRTPLEFIRACQCQAVEGRENLHIWTEKRFKDFVGGLKTEEGSEDDKNRKRIRKKLLLVENTPQKGENTDLGFTEGQLTQTSQLVRLASQVAKKWLKKTAVISIPGQVTAEVRKSWNTMGTLAHIVPDICDNEMGKLKTKKEIREITHLHHAVDACTLGLIPILIPAGNNGEIWKLLVDRKINDEGRRVISSINQPTVVGLQGSDRGVYLKDIPLETKSTMEQALAEKRVVRHIPADMSGAKLNEQYNGVVDYNPNGDMVTLRSRSAFYGMAFNDTIMAIPRKEAQRFIKNKIEQPAFILQFGQIIKISGLIGADSTKNGEWQIVAIDEKKKNKIEVRFSPSWGKKATPASELWELWKAGHISLGKVLPVTTKVKKSKLVGLNSPKMRQNAAAFEITANYGVVISPIIEVVRHASVYKTLKNLRKKYPGQMIKILRPGMLISITSHKDEARNGKWRVMSVKDNADGPALALQRVESASNKVPLYWSNASIMAISKSGLIIHEKSYVG